MPNLSLAALIAAPLRTALFALTIFTLLVVLSVESAPSSTSDDITGPHVHDNLAVYLITGPSRPGPVPLTLNEALAFGSVEIRETGNVSELLIENLVDRSVFIQSGEIIKGGQQDRVLTVSLLLPPKSGLVPISALCVEQGRWTARGQEDVARFSSAQSAIPSRSAKLAMRAPYAMASAGNSEVGNSRTFSATSQQTAVWGIVASTQRSLSSSVGASVVSEQSPTSLQLTLENPAIKLATNGYIEALAGLPETTADVVGYAFAINGELNSADIYPSSRLFEKLWPKLLRAMAIETATERAEYKPTDPPTRDDVSKFLRLAEAGSKSYRRLTSNNLLETRVAEEALFFETSRLEDGWAHRSYVANAGDGVFEPHRVMSVPVDPEGSTVDHTQFQ